MVNKDRPGLPVLLRLSGRPVVLVGDGPVAATQRRLLTNAGARIVEEGAKAQLAIVIDSPSAVSRLKVRGLLVYAVDRPDLSDFELVAEPSAIPAAEPTEGRPKRSLGALLTFSRRRRERAPEAEQEAPPPPVHHALSALQEPPGPSPPPPIPDDRALPPHLPQVAPEPPPAAETSTPAATPSACQSDTMGEEARAPDVPDGYPTVSDRIPAKAADQLHVGRPGHAYPADADETSVPDEEPQEEIEQPFAPPSRRSLKQKLAQAFDRPQPPQDASLGAMFSPLPTADPTPPPRPIRSSSLLARLAAATSAIRPRFRSTRRNSVALKAALARGGPLDPLADGMQTQDNGKGKKHPPPNTSG